jgi:alkyl sulfatase BDS1-like metallo-beta-lactamase superfamily hydrolase
VRSSASSCSRDTGDLVQAGKVQSDGDDTPLKELAALRDEFDPDFALVTPEPGAATTKQRRCAHGSRDR